MRIGQSKRGEEEKEEQKEEETKKNKWGTKTTSCTKDLM